MQLAYPVFKTVKYLADQLENHLNLTQRIVDYALPF